METNYKQFAQFGINDEGLKKKIKDYLINTHESLANYSLKLDMEMNHLLRHLKEDKISVMMKEGKIVEVINLMSEEERKKEDALTIMLRTFGRAVNASSAEDFIRIIAKDYSEKVGLDSSFYDKHHALLEDIVANKVSSSRSK